MADKTKVDEQKNYGPNLVVNKDVRERVSTYALQNIQSIVNSRGYLESKWIMLERLWRGDPISRFYPSAHSTHVPEPFKAVESLVPRIMKALMPNPEWFRAIPANEKSKGVSRAIELLLHDQMRDGDFRKNLEMFMRILCIQGFAAAKTPYVRDTQEFYFAEREEKDVYEDGTLVGTKPGRWKKEIFKACRDRTELMPLEIFDFLADPSYDDPIRKAPGCGDRTKVSKEYVHEMLDRGVYAGITHAEIDKLSKKPAKINTGLGADLRYTSIDNAMMTRRGEDGIIVSEWWGKTPLQASGPRTESVCTFLNEEVCVRIQQNRLWHQRRPYLYAQYVPEKGKLYGMGVIEPIIWLVQDLNDMRNTINTSAAIIANPMLKVEDSANVEDEQIIATPGRVLRTSNNKGVEPLYVPDMTAVARMAEAMTKQDIVETTGTTRLYYGTAEGGTATEALTRTREANERVENVVKAASESVTERFLENAHYNNHQFMKEERIVVLTGDTKGYRHFKVTPDKIQGPAKFQIMVAPQIELMGIRGQQMMQFMERVSANPTVQTDMNFGRLARIVWADLFGNREVDYIFPPDDTQELVSQEDENRLMLKGMEVEVKPWHNHIEHARIIQALQLTNEFEELPDRVQDIINTHGMNHEMWIKRLADRETNPQFGPAAAPTQAGSMSAPTAPPPQNAVGMGRVLANQARAGIQGG
jgi:hypothetical protein